MGWNSQVVIAQQVIIEGSDDGLFVYSGTPTTGNLIGSWASMAGTDDYENPYPAGLAIFNGLLAIYDPASITFPSRASFEQAAAAILSAVGGTSPAQYITTVVESASTTGTGAHDRVIAAFNSAAEDNSSSANLEFLYVHSNGNITEYAYMDETGFRVLAGTIIATHPGTTPAVPESWQTLALVNSFTNGSNNGFIDAPQIRMMADNQTLMFKGTLTCPATPTGVFASVPADYPNAGFGGPYGKGAVVNVSSNTHVGHVEVHNNGNIGLTGNFAAGDEVDITCLVPTQ